MSQPSRTENGDDDKTLNPRRLELSLSPEDGSLQTAPLSSVLLAATDGLYTDLYNMAHGELQVAQAVADTEEPQSQSGDTIDNIPPQSTTLKSEKMSNLSFAQRRHELDWRLAQHGKALTHVAALTAAAASSELSHATRISTKALQQARTAWVQADEAQDALYFFHAQLFPARRAPHDVYGALDLLKDGTWKDLPQDLQLRMDRYETSQEHRWSKEEVRDRWHMAVRDKLLRGEVGWMQRRLNSYASTASSSARPPLWKISLQGGIVRLIQGLPKTSSAVSSNSNTDKNSQQVLYPLEAHLTVLSTDLPAQWTLLALHVRAQAKTGESNHQLDTTDRQRYDLHRLAALAMSREESRHYRSTKDQGGKETETDEATPPRPLDCLFQVAHTFCLSMQLEILSAQALALKRGMWAVASDATTSTASSALVVTPVKFEEQVSHHQKEDGIIGIMSISFWDVDDRYGPPRMENVYRQEDSEKPKQTDEDDTERQIGKSPVASKLTLQIRAERDVGIRVALSGGANIMKNCLSKLGIGNSTASTLKQLLEATSNPFALSASDALLAATTLCGQQKCQAVVDALISHTADDKCLPSWMKVTVERGSIGISARVSYRGNSDETPNSSDGYVPLFRLGCDARTGGFVCLFARATQLLQLLASNDIAASESVALHLAKVPANRRKSAAAASTGRVVRDAFDGLIRSMNLLGRRVGVGYGAWDNLDEESDSLRQRAIQQALSDTNAALMTCCGIAAVYGLSPLALGIATGVTAAPDIAGGPVDSGGKEKYLAIPPVSVLMEQQMIRRTARLGGGEKKELSFLERSLYAVSCSVSNDSVLLCAFGITVEVDAPSSEPNRTRCEGIPLLASKPTVAENGEKLSKRARVDAQDNCDGNLLLLDEVENLSQIISSTIGT